MRLTERTPRRRTTLLTLVAAVAAMSAAAALGGSALAMRPVGAVTGSAGLAPAATSAPTATASALALQASAAAMDAPLTPQPTGAPTPSGTDPTGRPAPVVMPCNAAGVNSSATIVRPCPPGPCMMAGAPKGAMAPNPCPGPTPPPCQYLTANGASGQNPASCSPPPCATAKASGSPSFRDPCPTPAPKPTPQPCPMATNANQGDGSPAAMWMRPCMRWVTLTEKDSGRTITVKPGTWILVRLNGGGVWTEPVSSDGGVVTRTGAGTDRNGGSFGSFRGASAGTADLSAMDQPRCAPMCKVLTRSWTVHVVVAP
ncbi:MAG TPA: hypothetical protein VH134_05485 [Candidatus Dormibacteraeota bacterium]|nr:hypothetical protein [Candidatus Dormibacteraeota bacterium]